MKGLLQVSCDMTGITDESQIYGVHSAPPLGGARLALAYSTAGIPLSNDLFVVKHVR